MKKLLTLLAVMFVVTIFPLTAFANDRHHDRDWKWNHDREWRHHERAWKDHDREWREHRYDRHWREVHAREWNNWYRWHRDNDEHFRLRIANDDFVLDIDR